MSRPRRRLVVLCVGLVVGAAFQPAAAQDADTEAGAVEWAVVLPRDDRGATSPAGFVVDETNGHIYVGVVTDGGFTAADLGVDLGPGSYVLQYDVNGGFLAALPVSIPTRQIALTADGDVLVAANGAFVRLAPDGTERWARSVDGLRIDDITELADGTIVIGGYFNDPVVAPEGPTLTQGDRFGSSAILWLDAGGSYLGADIWTSGYEIDLAPAADGGVLVVGEVGEPIVLGRDTANEISLEMPFSEDDRWVTTVLANYAADRTVSWASVTGGSHSGDVLDLGVDASGSSVIWQSIDTTAVLGPGPASREASPLREEGEFGDDHLLMRYDAAGQLDWAHVIGSPTYSEEEYRSLGVRDDGRIVATGTFATGTVLFGGDQEPFLTLDTFEAQRHFISVFNPDGTLAWLTVVGSDSFDAGWGAHIFPDGDVVAFLKTGGATFAGMPGADEQLSDEASWVLIRFDGLEPAPEPEPTTTTTTTTTVAPTTTTEAAAPQPGDEDAAVPAAPDAAAPEADGEGGGAPIAIIVIVLLAVGGGALVLRNRSTA